MATEKWNLDAGHSTVGFMARHMVISKVRGSFTKVTGALELDPADPGKASVTATIEAASIATHDEKRDGHLKSADFLDVEKYPQITFRSTGIKGAGAELEVVGDLTIHGVTRPVTLQVESHGSGKDPWGGQRAGYSAKTSISRADFGLTWNVALEAGGFLVGDKIEIELEIEAVKA